MLLIPPGGFPDEFRNCLQVVKTKLSKGSDVCLDIMLVGSTTIPPELRDLSVRSHGSVLTVTDIDEVGAIAQRLKNEQSFGAWVIVPQVSTIPQVDQAAVQPFGGDQGAEALDALRTQIIVRSKIIDAMIAEANSILVPLSKQDNPDKPLSEAVKTQVNNARVNLQSFSTLRQNLDGAEVDARAKTDDPKVSKEEKHTANQNVLKLIALTRDSLKSLEGSINLARNMINIVSKKAVSPDEKNADNLVELFNLAQGYFNPDEKIKGLDFEQLKNDTADEKEKEIIDSLKNENISKIERLRRFLRLHEKWLEANLSRQPRRRTHLQAN